MNLRKICIALFCALFIMGLGMAAAPAKAQAETKIAVVDVERAVNECKQGKKAQAELTRRAQALQQELKDLAEQVQALRDELEKSAMLLKPEARLKKDREFERTMRLFKEKQRDANQEMGQARREAFEPIFKQMVEVIKDMGQQSGYTLIVNTQVTHYYAKSVDITDEVIQAYDKKHK